MTTTSEPAFGIYDALIDKALQDVLNTYPELRAVFGKLEPEEQPARYADFIARVMEQVLREEHDPAKRLALCNAILDKLSSASDGNRQKSELLSAKKSLLLEITPPHYGKQGIPRPHTPISESSLFTGSPKDPQLVHELHAEMLSADAVDILVSFIKWSGLRLLMPAFEDLKDRVVPVRVITTSYMGASDAAAIEHLARMPNVNVRVSYDTERTRLHAKAYCFKRSTGFSTAYIGSANMSHAAITSGLEWNLKITEPDMAHILEKFTAEFETYWNSHEFIPFDPEDATLLRESIHRARHPSHTSTVFFDLRPHPFQERILEALERERSLRGHTRNLVIAATGTGKTVVAAFDFKRFYDQKQGSARLLYLAHRFEILKQAMETFRNVLRDRNFGELQTGQHQATRLDHLFCSIGMLSNRKLWEQVGDTFYDYIIVDEAHHGTAASYRPIFAQFSPEILLGLTATPERMDGDNVLADFGNRFAAEIRLPEALEEKLLCPFHYFGVADPVSLNEDRFWTNGRYNPTELENVYTGAHFLAKQRLDTILDTLEKYEPDQNAIKGVGFCVTINHAKFMAEMFTTRGIPSAPFVSGIDSDECAARLKDLEKGSLTFLFTVDKFSEGVDLPSINVVLFLRPTESLTVFLQQLGRGLRHAPEKECLTVLDFVGQAHRKYRMDTKLKALLPKHRFSIEREVNDRFPHLPAGCAIQFDRIARQYVIDNIKENLQRLSVQVPDRLQTFTNETGQELTFGNFIRYHDYEPERLLIQETWTAWKAKAQLASIPADPDLARLKKALVRMAFIDGPREISQLRKIIGQLRAGAIPKALAIAGTSAISVHYRIWAERGNKLAIQSIEDSFKRLSQNPSILDDMEEILSWAESVTQVSGIFPELPFNCPFELHARYGFKDIQAAMGNATLESSGQTCVGILHFPAIKAYIILLTFQKTEKEFSPSTMYADYPISRELLHWESQSNTTQASNTGQNLIHHAKRGYTLLVFARGLKKFNNCTVPFSYLGPAERVSHESERPIKMVWRLRHPMPVEVFEENRKGG